MQQLVPAGEKPQLGVQITPGTVGPYHFSQSDSFLRQVVANGNGELFHGLSLLSLFCAPRRTPVYAGIRRSTGPAFRHLAWAFRRFCIYMGRSPQSTPVLT